MQWLPYRCPLIINTHCEQILYFSLFPCIQIARLFPSSKVTSVQEFSAYFSHRHYGFTMAFLVKLSSTITEGDIAGAYYRLQFAWGIDRLWIYLRSYPDPSVPQGLRAFVPSREFIIHTIRMHAISWHMHVICMLCLSILCAHVWNSIWQHEQGLCIYNILFQQPAQHLHNIIKLHFITKH